MDKLTKPSTASVTQEDWEAAEKIFHPNCGPTALAIIAGISIQKACEAIPGFTERHFTNPTMMATALRSLGIQFIERDDNECDGHTLTRYGLVRIQFEGPWTAAGANPKWAYRQTHWIAAAEFMWGEPVQFVFDINCGWQTAMDWEHIHVPEIIKGCLDKRATGNWWATHRWELS